MAKTATGKVRNGRKATGKPRRRKGVSAGAAPRAKRRIEAGKPRDGRAGSGINSLLVTFAHDIRTPLGAVLALADLLATSGLGERERSWVGEIKDAAEHLIDVTTLMIEGARSRAGHLPRREDVFDLPHFAAALAASLAARAQAKKIDCRCDMAGDLPAFVRGSPAHLRIALENLVANAVKFTERGEVGLAVAATPGPGSALELSFAVADSGIGLTKAEIGRLFRPFAQANPDIAAKFGGAGLGLAETRRLARAMGGDVTVASTPGRGSIFRLTVTAERAEPSPGPAAASLPLQSPGIHRMLKVLCVEDNPHGRVVMNAILTELGHRVDFAESGEAALDAIAGRSYDVVLMDLTLAGMDGRETTTRIRALPGPAARVPVVGISGRAGNANMEAALAAGMNAFFEKPVSARALSEMLDEIPVSSATSEQTRLR